MKKNFILQKFFVGILKVNDEKRRIKIRINTKCHGSATLENTVIVISDVLFLIRIRIMNSVFLG
jgi:hypothetical protein